MPLATPGRWMKSSATTEFWQLYRELPEPVRQTARRTYRLWKEDPRASALRFKKVRDAYPIRIGNTGYRAIATDVSPARAKTTIVEPPPSPFCQKGVLPHSDGREKGARANKSKKHHLLARKRRSSTKCFRSSSFVTTNIGVGDCRLVEMPSADNLPGILVSSTTD